MTLELELNFELNANVTRIGVLASFFEWKGVSRSRLKDILVQIWKSGKLKGNWRFKTMRVGPPLSSTQKEKIWTHSHTYVQRTPEIVRELFQTIPNILGFSHGLIPSSKMGSGASSSSSKKGDKRRRKVSHLGNSNMKGTKAPLLIKSNTELAKNLASNLDELVEFQVDVIINFQSAEEATLIKPSPPPSESAFFELSRPFEGLDSLGLNGLGEEVQAVKKKFGRKPVARSLDDEIAAGNEGLDEVEEVTAVDSHEADRLKVTVEMARSQEIQETEIHRSGSSRTKSWAEEVEDDRNVRLDNQQSPGSAKQICETFTKGKTQSRDQLLLFTEPLIRDGIKIAQVDLDEVQEEEKNWNTAVICKVLGANPPVTIFEGFVKRIWGHLGVLQVSKLSMGLIMVKFNDEATRDQVVEAGVVQFDRKPVIVRPQCGFECNDTVRLVPLWIRLHDLGLQYWGTKSLSALVSTIGKPIMVDQHTKDRTRLQYARVLVEMEITDAPPRFIPFFNEFGQLQDQNVEYEWLPANCTQCSKFGHTKATCRHDEFVKQKAEKKEHQQEKSKQPPKKDSKAKAASTIQQEWVVPKKTIPVATASHHGSPKKKVEIGSNSFTLLQEQNEGRVEIQDTVYDLCCLNKIGVCGLLETKLKNDRISEMMTRKFPNWNWYTSPIVENRILIMWRKNFTRVIVVREDPQFIHCYVKLAGYSEAMNVTFVYGFSTGEERKELWEGLIDLKVNAKPWLITGDFNSLFELEDRMGGKDVNLNDIRDSSNWLAQSHLDRPLKTGSGFTWTNNQEGDKRIYSKIDHTFVNEDWNDSFPLTKAL
uniref:DUF4283 domain-containing protein n=1 Tax=Cannabis sativa TaxID=3483 RepID=A0A803P8U6_CANSA